MGVGAAPAESPPPPARAAPPTPSCSRSPRRARVDAPPSVSWMSRRWSWRWFAPASQLVPFLAEDPRAAVAGHRVLPLSSARRPMLDAMNPGELMQKVLLVSSTWLAALAYMG